MNYSRVSRDVVSVFLRLVVAMVAAIGMLTALQGCTASITGGTDTGGPPTATPIKHVVVIFQENRTFDNMFHDFPGADSADSGLSGTTVVPMAPVDLDDPRGVDNSHPGFWGDWDHGKMDGFSRKYYTPTTLAYSYVPQADIQPYWTLATQYTLGDAMFQSSTGPSYPAHQYMIAAQSALADEDPTGSHWGCDDQAGSQVLLVGPNGTDKAGVFPCFDYQTVADLLDAQGISWRYYYASGPLGGAAFGPAFEAIKHIFNSSDYTNNVITPQTQVLTDIASGQLAAVTWITPDINHSDHPGTRSKEGPDWVASIVNAIGNSKFWNSTAIFVTWDDWGGWYDHVAPVQLDSMGLGFRVPLIVVSPYAKRGYVSHTAYETASLVTYVEKNFMLGNLGARDANANDMFDCFDFTQHPPSFKPIATNTSVEKLMSEPDSGPPDPDDVFAK